MASLAGARRRVRARLDDSPGVARARGRRHVAVLGDSHVAVFDGWSPPGFAFRVTSAPGATASGIRNPNSASAALPRLRGGLARVRRGSVVLVLLGEVDCGYIIWKRAAGLGGVEAALDDAVERYGHFLEEVAATSAPVWVMSVPLPTLPDEPGDWGPIARRRADVRASQRERTALTLRFNERVAALAGGRGHRWLDSTSGQLDPVTGLVRAEFVQVGAGDHHLRDEPYRRELLAALRRAEGSPAR